GCPIKRQPGNLRLLAQSDQDPNNNEQQLISNVRQLTFEGKRAGEGYFGSDGSQMVFQSERRDDNPFFQIYLLDFELGDIIPISPGHGKTTCAWLHPSGDRVIFSSTQDDPQARDKQRREIEFRESGQERRYSWDYDPTYEIYSYELSSQKYIQLTDAEGYDAEGSYSPDGKLIAFASNRNGFSKPLSEEQKKAFDVDPAVMMDIFIMDADGKNVKQLTEVMGYDGGPFFSPDGQRICWRRFSENGLTAEIMTMNIDGSDQKQITNMRAMSWAPFYHPSGQYLIYTTNKHGFGNFELYMVSTDGKSQPVRVTETKGFDGLASFSPDGTKMTWTTKRNAKKTSQIFLADWDHKKALQLLGIDGQEPGESMAQSEGVAASELTSDGFEAPDVMRHVDYLCRKELGGRMTGSPGERKATAYAAAYMDSLGLMPDGDNGSWFQNFDFPAGAELTDKNRLLVKDSSLESKQTSLAANEDWRPLTFSGNGVFEPSEVVFVGYGIEALEEAGQAAYDSYSEVDVSGKWVLALRYLPEDVDEEKRSFLARHSAIRKKVMIARDKGARGIIFVSGPKSNVKNELIPLSKDFSIGGTSIAALSVTDRVADSWLSRNGIDLQTIQTELDSGKLTTPIAIQKIRLSATIEVKPITGSGRNVIGRLQMGEQPSAEAVLVGAHIDHLGTGGSGSLAKSDEKGQTHFGADDNASGVAAMLEIAEFLAGLKRKGKLPLKRDIIFAGWSGEELGLYGSKFFANQKIPKPEKTNNKSKLVPYAGDPHNMVTLLEYYQQYLDAFDTNSYTKEEFELLQSNLGDMKIVVKLLSSSAANSSGRNNETIANYRPVIKRAEGVIANALDSKPAKKETRRPIAACVNMDMVGRMRDELVLQGLGSSPAWNRLIEKANVVVGLAITTSDDTQLPTDASSFYQAGVPILSAFTGSHNDYHTPRDTPEKLNYPDAAKIAHLLGLITRQLAISDSPPEYIRRTEQPSKRVASTGRRARLGTVPNYTEKVNGVLLDDVESGGPAAVAGLQGGDVIVELSGQKIENIYDYQYAIDALKVGKSTTIAILRNDEIVKLEIIPGSRD
ncbi:MAG: M28 family peptidase, partial [Planctomycetota bacterium]